MYITSNNNKTNLNEVFAPFVNKNPNIWIGEKADSFELENKNPKNNKSEKIKKAGEITGILILSALGFAALSRTGTGRFIEHLEKHKKVIDNNLNNLEKSKNVKAIVYYSKMFFGKAIQRPLNSLLYFICNMDQIKNRITARCIDHVPPLSKLRDKINGFLTNKALEISEKEFKEFKDSYNLLGDKLSFVVKKLEESNIQGKDELIKSLKDQIKINNSAIDNFSSRLDKKDEILEKLHETTEKYDLRLSKMVEDFITGKTKQTRKDLRGLRENVYSRELRDFREWFELTKGEIISAENILSKSISDNCKNIKQLVYQARIEIKDTKLGADIEKDFDEIDDIVKKYGESSGNILKRLSESTKTGNTLQNQNSKGLFSLKSKTVRNNSFSTVIDERELVKQERDKLRKEFFEKTEEIIKKLNSEKGPEKEKAVEYLNSAKNILKNDKPGVLEQTEILLNKNQKILEEILPPGEFDKIKKLIENSSKQAKKFNTLMEDVIYRLLDIELGNGVFEILTPQIPMVLLVNEVLRSNSKEEKESKAIRLGLPIGGGILIWYYSIIIKCLNGPKGIAAGLTAGILLDSLAKMIDKQVHPSLYPDKKQF